MSKKNNKAEQPLYYMENGLIVFTAAYHLQRGYCCKSGCRHCPYDRKSNKPFTRTDKSDDDLAP